MGPIDEVLDSNIVIDALLGRLDAIAALRSPVRRAISIITWIEVMAGAKDDDAAHFAKFLGQFTLVQVTPQRAVLAARFRKTLRLKLPDAVIFATAQDLKCPLVTRNTRDFPPGTPESAFHIRASRRLAKPD